MGFDVSMNTNNSIYGTRFSPLMSNSFQDNLNFSLPFPAMDFGGYMNGDFMSTMNLFNMFMMGSMPKAWQGQMFNKDFNTRTNLPALKNVYDADTCNKLANIAEKNALRTNTVKWCYHGVKDSLSKAGLNNGEITGGSAYQARGVLSNHNKFTPVTVDKKDLKNLPAGCVIVWNPFTDRKGKYHKDGHIAITLGDGREASDHVQNLVIGETYSVFVPKGLNKKA